MRPAPVVRKGARLGLFEGAHRLAYLSHGQLVGGGYLAACMGALARGSKDAALWLTLEPGIYTLQISGGDGGSGVALAEIYEVPAE